MADPKEAQDVDVDADANAMNMVAAGGELNLSVDNAAQDGQCSPPQLPFENKVGDSSALDNACLAVKVETLNSTSDSTQPAPSIELAPEVHDSAPISLQCSDAMPCATGPESLSTNIESLHDPACEKPTVNGSLDDAGLVSNVKQETDNEDASFKSKHSNDSSPDDNPVVPEDKQPSTAEHEENSVSPTAGYQSTESRDDHRGEKVSLLKDAMARADLSSHSEAKKGLLEAKLDEETEEPMRTPAKTFLLEPSSDDGYESGTEEEQAEFMKEVETCYKENHMEFKPPKFYKEELNLLKLWRAVIKLGGYEQVTSCKLWRQVGESFRPPKTCTTVSWTFRIFYEKALLEYEKQKMRNGELPFSDGMPLPTEATRPGNQPGGSLSLVSGRAPRRDAAARAMQGWHSRLLGNDEVCQPVIKDKLSSIPKVDKSLKTNGLLKRKKPSSAERSVHVSPLKTMRTQADAVVVDVGPPAEWVKINVQRTNDCFEVYALVPGLLREEVHVQSDPAGRLIISGQPEQLENPWGVTPFKKVVSLPSRIDAHQTSAVVTLHGQLFVRVPFEQSDV
ncbi:AT-rich interactive domain-containing protein 3 [Linum grandiflorum]